METDQYIDPKLICELHPSCLHEPHAKLAAYFCLPIFLCIKVLKSRLSLPCRHMGSGKKGLNCIRRHSSQYADVAWSCHFSYVNDHTRMLESQIRTYLYSWPEHLWTVKDMVFWMLKEHSPVSMTLYKVKQLIALSFTILGERTGTLSRSATTHPPRNLFFPRCWAVTSKVFLRENNDAPVVGQIIAVFLRQERWCNWCFVFSWCGSTGLRFPHYRCFLTACEHVILIPLVNSSFVFQSLQNPSLAGHRVSLIRAMIPCFSCYPRS